MNAEFIHMALPQSDRIKRLNAIAIRQMRTLTARTVRELEGGGGVKLGVRLAAQKDLEGLAPLRAKLWPEESPADGCDPSHPVGYLEGWFVSESHRKTGIGKRLVEHGEAWAKAQGCKELASA